MGRAARPVWPAIDAPALLAPGALPALWQSSELTFGALVAYFAGGKVVQVDRGGYSEPVTIPRADRETLAEAVKAAIKDGHVWLTAGPTSLYQEDVPEGVLNDPAVLQAPPQPISARDALALNLPEAWASGSETTARAIADALATRVGKPLPWSLIRQAIDGAFVARYLERTPDSGPWPCDVGGASAVRVRLPTAAQGEIGQTPAPARTIAELPLLGALAAEAYLTVNEVQNLADQIGELKKLAIGAGLDLKVQVRIELSGDGELPPETLVRLNALLQAVSSGLMIG